MLVAVAALLRAAATFLSAEDAAAPQYTEDPLETPPAKKSRGASPLDTERNIRDVIFKQGPGSASPDTAPVSFTTELVAAAAATRSQAPIFAPTTSPRAEDTAAPEETPVPEDEGDWAGTPGVPSPNRVEECDTLDWRAMEPEPLCGVEITPDVLEDKQLLLNDAVQFIHLVLLRDLRPPWLAYNFLQALSGEGVMSRFTRPLLLYWSADHVITLFGIDVHTKLCHAADRVGLVLAGVIARPLYKCTEVKDASTGEICMNVASMSPFLQNCRDLAYQCKDCAAKAQIPKAAPGSASAALRGLWAYPMVETVDGQATPLRVSTKIRMLVHAPPDTLSLIHI